MNMTEEKKVSADKAGEEYWTQFWKNFQLPAPINIHSPSVNEFPSRVLHELFVKSFSSIETKGKKLLEIGCGNSVFLPYLQKEFGFDVTGIDYSEFGCEQSKKILERDNVKGTIIHADALNPPMELLGTFDVVCSFGVIEHFAHTAETLSAFARFLKPGGLLITTLPNMKGATGLLHKWLNKPVYDVHVPLDKQDMHKALHDAGLEIKVNEYFLALSFAITLEGADGKPIPNYMLKKVFVKSIRYASKLIWLIEDRTRPLKPGKYLSGGIFTAAIKPL